MASRHVRWARQVECQWDRKVVNNQAASVQEGQVACQEAMSLVE